MSKKQQWLQSQFERALSHRSCGRGAYCRGRSGEACCSQGRGTERSSAGTQFVQHVPEARTPGKGLPRKGLHERAGAEPFITGH